MTIAQEVFDGVMASDGGLIHPRNCRDACFNMALSDDEHNDWLNLVKTALTALGALVPLRYPCSYLRTSPRGKPYTYTCLFSRTSSIMSLQRRRWYPEGRKVLPEDLELTPIMLANWFMGDGHSSRDKRYPKVIYTLLATQCFDNDSIQRFVNAAYDIGINTGQSRYKASGGKVGTVVTVKQDSVDKFMSMIEPHMVPSFMYKIKYKDRAQM